MKCNSFTIHADNHTGFWVTYCGEGSAKQTMIRVFSDLTSLYNFLTDEWFPESHGH